MGTRYNIMVTATDAATARVKAIKKTLGSVVQPIADVGRSIKALGKETGVDKLGKGLASVGRGAAGAIRAIGGLNPALAGVVGVGGLAALAGYTKQLIYAQSATLRFSTTSGVAATRLQTMEGAAKLAGLSSKDLDSTVQNLGQTLNDAKWGRNQGALMMMNRLGMQLKYTKKGAVDADASLTDLATILGPGGKLAKASIQTKTLVTDQFGATALLPILVKGPKAWADYQKAAAAAKPPISEEDLKRADQYRQKIDQMALSFDGLGQAFAKWAAPGAGGVADWVTQRNKNAANNIGKRGFFGAIGYGAGAYAGDAARGIGHLGKSALDGMGLTPKAWRDLGNLISAGEGGYDSVNTGKKGGYKSAHVPLVESSIKSIMDAQGRGDFNAAGKYQMTKQTLRQAVQALHLDTTQKFDQGMQERIFREYLIQMKRPEIADYVSGKSNDKRAAVKAASKEWASLADPDTGQSHYAGIANNKASVSVDQVAAALDAARQAQKTAPEKAKRYVVGSDPAAEAALAGKPAPDAPLKTGFSNPKTATVAGEIVVTLKGAPPGTAAEVTKSSGPVKTVLKTESSMPDFNL